MSRLKRHCGNSTAKAHCNGAYQTNNHALFADTLYKQSFYFSTFKGLFTQVPRLKKRQETYLALCKCVVVSFKISPKTRFELYMVIVVIKN